MTLRKLPLASLLLLSFAACSEAGKPAQAPSPTAATAPAAAPGDPVAEAAASYRVTAAFAPAVLLPAPAGAARKGALEIAIEMTRPDVHVQAEFPLKLTLTPTAGLNLGKLTLGHADAVDPAAKGRRWVVPITAATSGRQRAVGAVRFAICKETAPEWCVTRNEELSAEVEAR